MKRIVLLVGLCVLVFGVSLRAQAQAQAPKPDPELKKLGIMAGHWTYEGEYKSGPPGLSGKVKGEDTIQWILGGFFLEELMIERGAAGESRSAFIYAYDPNSKNIVITGLGTGGSLTSGIAKITGNTFIFDGKIVTAGVEALGRVTLVVAGDLMSMAQNFEISTDGKTWIPFFEGKMTKVKPVPKTK